MHIFFSKTRWAHVTVGGTQGHLGWVENSPDDPIFYLVHSMTDMLWTLWQDCYNHEQIHQSDLDRFGDVIYDENPRAALLWGALETATWSELRSSTNRVTAGDLHLNQDWGVSYDKGIMSLL